MGDLIVAVSLIKTMLITIFSIAIFDWLGHNLM